MNPSRRRSLVCLLLASVATIAAPPSRAADAQDFSVAERALFMTPQLAGLKPPTTLAYTFRRTGSLEPAFDDRVGIKLTARADGTCCAASGQFLSGARQERTAEVESAEGNPVTLYFLDHDIAEMKRLTGGAQNYFRKLIRMAIYQGAQVRDTRLRYRGREVAGREIAITPYVADPLRGRYTKFAGKQYLFTLSSAVPGGVYGIRTVVPGESPNAPPLIVEELTIDGAGAP